MHLTCHEVAQCVAHPHVLLQAHAGENLAVLRHIPAISQVVFRVIGERESRRSVCLYEAVIGITWHLTVAALQTYPGYATVLDGSTIVSATLRWTRLRSGQLHAEE